MPTLSTSFAALRALRLARNALFGAVLGCLPLAALAQSATPSAIPSERALSADEPGGKTLLERLRRGGLVVFFRHADTRGMPCDTTFQVGDRAGQRNLSEDGRAQSRLLGQRLQALNVPVAWPVLAGPVARARDTAELAFGVARVRVVDGLLADDYAGGKLDWVLGEHRRLFAEPVPARANRVLVGHRTPAIMVLGPAVAGAAFPEGAALVLEPSADGSSPLLLGSFALAPIAGGGFHQC